MRNLLIFLLALLGIWWIRRALQRAKDGRGAQTKSDRRVEHMVECGHCGIHVPETESVRDGERFYCCEAHRLAGPRQRD